MFSKHLLVASVAAAMAWASPAAADNILFNPTGGGTTGAITIDTLDQAPGNAIAENITVPTATVGATTTLSYQANLGSALLSSSQVYTQGGGGNFFTFTAQFNETVTGATPLGSGFALSFGLTPSGTNTFNMYVDTTGGGNNLAGTGFNSGTLILSGTAVTSAPTMNFSDVFNFNCITPTAGCTQPLDVTGINNYPSVTTLPGIGDAAIPVRINFANAGYFPNLFSGAILPFALTNTSEFTPFNTADPSAVFFNGLTGVGDVGSVNGFSGPDTMLEADASTSFVLQPVPEPATLSLLGIGLLSSAAARRRQKRQAAK